MKLFRFSFAIFLTVTIFLSTTSCLVLSTRTNGSGGSPRGWHKNTNNPHNPNTTNPGHSKGRGGK